MRVGLDYRSALLGRSGIGRYTRELCRALGKLPETPPMALLGHSWKKPAFAMSELGLRPPLQLFRHRVPSRAMRWAHTIAGISTERWLGSIDLFHFPDFVYPPLRPTTPFVATLHDAAFLEPGFFPAQTAEALRERAAWAVAHARLLLAPSAFAAGELVIRLGAKPSKVVVTPLGCEHLPTAKASDAERSHGTSATPYLLTVGTIEPRKNHRRILEAIESLHAKGFPHRWIVAGQKGWMCEPFFESLRRSPSRERVEILFDCAESKLAALYAGATALVYASLYEGFGLPLVEAMRAGTPIVTSAIASMPEVCADAAVFVDPRESASIADGIAQLIEKPALASRLLEAGPRRAAAFSWERCARATLGAYTMALR